MDSNHEWDERENGLPFNTCLHAADGHQDLAEDGLRTPGHGQQQEGHGEDHDGEEARDVHGNILHERDGQVEGVEHGPVG